MTSTRASIDRALTISIDCRRRCRASSLARGRRSPSAGWLAARAPRRASPASRSPQPRAAGGRRRVLGHRKIGKERRVLVDHGDAMALGVGGAEDGVSRRPSGSGRVGLMMPPRIFTSVLLPAPFSPASECTRPACRLRSTSLSTSTGPKRLVMPRSSTSGVTPTPPACADLCLRRHAPSAALSKSAGRMPPAAPRSPAGRLVSRIPCSSPR